MQIPDYLPDITRLQAWRPSLPGDAETHDIMAFYSVALALLGPAPTIVEIGVAHGRSLAWCAHELLRLGRPGGKVYGIDPWLGPGDPATGHSSMSFSVALSCIAGHFTEAELQLVHLVREPSPEALRLFPPHSVDLVMIDGCHEHHNVSWDILHSLEILKPGGILAGHDHTPQFPGVVLAVRQLLGRRVQFRGTVWIRTPDDVERRD